MYVSASETCNFKKYLECQCKTKLHFRQVPQGQYFGFCIRHKLVKGRKYHKLSVTMNHEDLYLLLYLIVEQMQYSWKLTFL